MTMPPTRSQFSVANGTLPIDHVNVPDDVLALVAGQFQRAWLCIPGKARVLLAQYWQTRALPLSCVRPVELQEHHPHLMVQVGIGSPRVFYAVVSLKRLD